MTITSQTCKAVLLGDGSKGAPGNPFTFVFNNGYAFGAVSQAQALTYYELVFTAADGTQTPVTIGPGPGQAQVTLNQATAGSLWGMGGSIVYQLNGSPIPAGTTLTILRQVPATQLTSLQNQSSYGQYASSAEQAVDRIVMMLQQLLEQYGRSIVVNVADATEPNPLPPAKQRAGKALFFDADGNPTVGDLGSGGGSGTISDAMAPVVSAATLQAARNEMGLLGLSTLNLGAGLQNDGSDGARVNSAITAVSSNQNLTVADHRRIYAATGNLTFNLPAASSTSNGFEFTAISLTGTISLVPSGSDTIGILASGQSLVLPALMTCRIRSNGVSAWYALPHAPAVASRYLRTNAAGVPDVTSSAASDNLDAFATLDEQARDNLLALSGTEPGATGLGLLATANVADALTALGLTRYSFQATKNGADQAAITAATPTKITFGTEAWDSGNIYNIGDSTLLPPAGRYRLTAQVQWSAGLDADQDLYCWIYKNSAPHKGAIVRPGTGATQATVAVEAIVEANGTDTFEVYAQADGTSDKTISGNAVTTFFCGEAI